MNFGSYLWSIMKEDGLRMSVNNNFDMNPTSTRYLVADYLNYRLRKKNYVWSDSPPLQTTNKIHRAMRNLADEFEQRYTTEFSSMVDQLHVTEDIGYPTFNAVAQELFVDGINWGRIVALFTFGGAIAIQCCEKDMPHLVDAIYEWVSTYVETHLEQWINNHNGWDGLAEFYEKSPEKNDQSLWPKLGRVCLGAVGVLALGALLTQKT